MEEQTRKTHAVHKTQESSIWNHTSSTSILEAIVGTYIEWVFKLNEYNKCVTNRQ